MCKSKKTKGGIVQRTILSRGTAILRNLEQRKAWKSCMLEEKLDKVTKSIIRSKKEIEILMNI